MLAYNSIFWANWQQRYYTYITYTSQCKDYTVDKNLTYTFEFANFFLVQIQSGKMINMLPCFFLEGTFIKNPSPKFIGEAVGMGRTRAIPEFDPVVRIIPPFISHLERLFWKGNVTPVRGPKTHHKLLGIHDPPVGGSLTRQGCTPIPTYPRHGKSL